MKSSRIIYWDFFILCCFILACLLVFSGCHQWPKDSYITKAESTISVPVIGITSTQKFETLATGTAARNLSDDIKPGVVKK